MDKAYAYTQRKGSLKRVPIHWTGYFNGIYIYDEPLSEEDMEASELTRIKSLQDFDNYYQQLIGHLTAIELATTENFVKRILNLWEDSNEERK